MRLFSHVSLFVLAGCIAAPPMMGAASAGEDQPPPKNHRLLKSAKKAAVASAKLDDSEPGVSLLDAVRKGQVTVHAEGSGDGRMTLAVTNRTS